MRPGTSLIVLSHAHNAIELLRWVREMTFAGQGASDLQPGCARRASKASNIKNFDLFLWPIHPLSVVSSVSHLRLSVSIQSV